MKSIYIFGNANPAAYFRKKGRKNDIVIKKAVYQKSVFNFEYTPLTVAREDIRLENEWAANHVFDDFRKEYVKDILEDPSDYILIDALGSVVPLCEVSAGGVTASVTYNKYMRETCERLQQEKKLSIGGICPELNETQVRERTIAFCEKLTSVYRQEQIIVHKATYPEYFLYNGQLVSFGSVRLRDHNKGKKLLKIIYDTMQWHMPYAHFIEMLPKTYATGPDKPLEYGREYMDFLTTAICLILFPDSAQQLIDGTYAEYVGKAYSVPKKGEREEIDLSLAVDECMYQFEQYNRKLREYEGRFLELYNEIMHTEYCAGGPDEKTLTFEEFLSIEKYRRRKISRPHGKLWRIFAFPVVNLKKFFAQVRKRGLFGAVRYAMQRYKANLKK